MTSTWPVVEWLPWKLAEILGEFYGRSKFSGLPSDPDYSALVHRGRFPRPGRRKGTQEDVTSSGDLARLSIMETRNNRDHGIRLAHVMWRISRIEADALVDGPAPANGVGFEVEVRHRDADHCGQVLDCISASLFPHMVALDGIYDKDDDPTIQELREFACIAEFALDPHLRRPSGA